LRTIRMKGLMIDANEHHFVQCVIQSILDNELIEKSPRNISVS
jgi:hypothetical protein